MDTRSPLSEYLQAHIPGAVFVDLDSVLAGPPSPARGTSPAPGCGRLRRRDGSARDRRRRRRRGLRRRRRRDRGAARVDAPGARAQRRAARRRASGVAGPARPRSRAAAATGTAHGETVAQRSAGERRRCGGRVDDHARRARPGAVSRRARAGRPARRSHSGREVVSVSRQPRRRRPAARATTRCASACARSGSSRIPR